MVQATDAKTVERAGVSSPSTADAEATARLANRYTFRNPGAVTRYLERYPHLVPHLHEIADRVPQYFDDAHSLALAMFFDPEFDDQEGNLFVNILIPSYDDDDTLDRLDRFGNDWWYLAAPPLPGTVVLDVEPA